MRKDLLTNFTVMAMTRKAMVMTKKAMVMTKTMRRKVMVMTKSRRRKVLTMTKKAILMTKAMRRRDTRPTINAPPSEWGVERRHCPFLSLLTCYNCTALQAEAAARQN